MTARRLLPVLLVLGVGLMVPFESAITRVLGMACLVAFVAGGLYAVATPAFLAQRDEDAADEPPTPRA